MGLFSGHIEYIQRIQPKYQYFIAGKTVSSINFREKKRKSTSVIAVKIHLVGWLGSEVSTGLVLVFVSASARSGLDAFEAVFEVTHIQC